MMRRASTMKMTMPTDKLSDRLKGMLLETATKDNGKDASSSSQPLIQVLRSDGEGAKSNSSPKIIDVGGNEDDDDDCPPPIFHAESAATPSSSSSGKGNSPESSKNDNSSEPPAPSLAEQLLADANIAKEKQQKEQIQREKQRAKKSTFGMKKGFLNSSNGSKSKGEKGGKKKSEKQGGLEKQQVVDEIKAEENELIYELDSDGNMVPTSKSVQQSHKNKDPLQLPEVQNAMLNHLQSNSSQWATPDLLDTITQNHPKLARGMNDPRYMAALQGMQTNPKGTLEQLKKTSPEILEWLQEFCGVMGEHFVNLGDEHDGNKDDGKKNSRVGEDEKIREMGPLEKKAVQKAKEQSAQQSAEQNQKGNNAMNDQVSSILANDELRSILLDPKMQQVMEECSTGNKMRYYMGHDEYGPKLRKLIEAGLIRFA